jgi:nucleotide-binding universal stress UspA family protein
VIAIRRILCPTDFSDISSHALAHAVVVARWYDAEIAALHAENPAIVLNAIAPVPPDAVDAIVSAYHPERSERRLRAWLAPAETAGVRTRVIAEQGIAARCILAHARTLPADLIVIGTHGESGFERLMLGSVTEKVLRKAACPVMTVPPNAPGTSALPFRHVLCPMDFSDWSLSALEYAFSLAQEADARVTLLHVGEWPVDDATAARVFETSEWRADATRRMASLVPAEVRNWCTPDIRLACGKPYQRILEIAGAEQVDLIVMGVRGRNPIDVLLFGSTTNHVVRHAACPVLTLRR